MPQLLVLLLLVAALIAFVAYPILATHWLSRPFIGVFLEPGMLVNDVTPAQFSSAWAAQALGAANGDRLVTVDGQIVGSAQDLAYALETSRPGDMATLSLMNAAGEERTLDVRLSRFPTADRFTFCYLPYLIGLILLVSGIWFFLLRRNSPSGRALSIFMVSLGVSTAGLFDFYTTHAFSSLWLLSVALAGAAMLAAAFLFPTPRPWVNRKRWLRWMPFAAAILLAGFAVCAIGRPSLYRLAVTIEFVFTVLCILAGLVLLARRSFSTGSPVEREQLRWIVMGGLLSFGLILGWLIGTPLWSGNSFTPLLLVPMAIFPLVTGYTIQRHNIVQTDFVISRGVLYSVLAVLITVGYALLVAGLGLTLDNVLRPNSPLIAGLAIFLLALFLLPLRQRLERMLDRIFFRGERAYQERLKTFSGELTGAVELSQILAVLRQYIEQSMQPQRLHIFVLDSFTDQYVAAKDADGQSTSDLRFSHSSALVQMLNGRKSPLYINTAESLPLALQPESVRISLLGSQVYVPLLGREQLTGWIALGQRRSGEVFTNRDLSFLDSLSDQASLAIERAQVMDSMEKRMQEMNVLTRVAQGVNITISLDDIFELIYAQTTQIIPTDDFSLILYDSARSELIPVFVVEKDDRVPQKENKPLEATHTLEYEVLHQRRPVVADDYSREVQRRGLLGGSSEWHAWLCVPLNTGAETIGLLSLADREPNVYYTQEQLGLLQAIADQVAGAIVKARLLGEAERRTRQLTTLNEVTRQLTSTLELKPLLSNILNKAVEILNCEAGSLLMVDDQTDDLVISVAVGEVADTLVGQRVPAGSGVVGKSVRTCLPVMVNDVQKSSDWFSKPDKQTGFVTRALLVIPLMVQDRVIGVIEVINRRDGLAFTIDDQDLLSAFAAQAGVAIQNARLYTNTDQALSARVEELQVMQRIDRELNTSLDITRAMRITLEWAMRQSGASAGLVTIVQDKTLQIMASQGYSNELDIFAEGRMPSDQFQLEQVVESGAPRQLTVAREGGLLHGARNQTIIPIRRETATTGLILLESLQAESYGDEKMNFLLRLSDHASIAIANAQLYAAVQAANLAKSEFVSFVAHELKNPMTSIKGYTELLAVGAVGPINEAQTNFLSTIRSNIDRMNTLISDLNDVTKIEVGRLRLDFKAIKLAEIVEEINRSTHKQIEEKNQKFEIVLPQDLPPVWADRVRLTQVLVNLVSNANKYTDKDGEILLSAERTANRWDEQGAAEVVHIWVRDNGIGISEEDQTKIFQKFFRSEDPKTREAPGTGLGLNITRSLVEMQGGKIWFESEYRVGTTFHITVPVAEQ
ncbi:histidine kinase [Longilinea arvoryzae]|uniref:histidine kinase n=1 Tax=Longilinea arvoryzae TaxID=360412 RepID=A0A0S7B9S2_9CHLR|nr:GAF domain-containing protein [Longilinea arvoryzae]GAP14078.1 histidine kinase [Longilinea arvoryzae]